MMPNQILYQTLRYLHDDSSARYLLELHLTPYFTTAALDDGSVGACMSYYRLPLDLLAKSEQVLSDLLVDSLESLRDPKKMDDALEKDVRDQEQRGLLITAVTATVVSALSAPLLSRSEDHFFQKLTTMPSGWADAGKKALVVGFGGMLKSLLQFPNLKHIHSIDLYYSHESATYARAVDLLRSEFPNCELTFSKGFEQMDDIKRFDVVAITGSTLCNGTLEGLLSNTRREAVVVLQGQSASIYPRYLFTSGVDFIATTLKPKHLNQLAAADRSGEAMRNLLDGGLPQIILQSNQAYSNAR